MNGGHHARRSAQSQKVSLVIGLGEVGRPLLEVLSRVHRVEGLDIERRPISDSVDFMHVCYPAEIEDFVGVTEAYSEQYGPDVVVIHSTVPVGTSRRVQERVSRPVVHSPVRGKHTRMVQELTHYRKFVGADDPAVAEHLQRYLEAAGMRTQYLPAPEATELAKLTETTYFGLLIAFAQDVDRMARQHGVPYDDVASFYEEIGYLPPVKYFPGVIGGHCVMPNVRLLKQTLSSKLLDAVEWSNEVRLSEEPSA